MTRLRKFQRARPGKNLVLDKRGNRRSGFRRIEPTDFLTNRAARVTHELEDAEEQRLV
jgi:hypothetical protein